MVLKLEKKLQLTNDVWSFRFKADEPVIWKPGQFFELVLKHKNPDERGTKRFFTISSIPSENFLQITTKFVLKDGSSFKKALLKLKPGEEVVAGHPQGNFVVNDANEKMVFIAGGIGITPFRAILNELKNMNLIKDITLLYANRDQEIAFKNELNKISQRNRTLKIHYIIEPEMINREKILSLVPKFNEAKYYISGPFAMVKAVSELLKKLSIDEKNLVHDYFPGY